MNEFITRWNAVGQTFVNLAGSLLVQSSLLILAVLVLDLLLRHRVKAVVRYWIWMLVLVKLVLPPSLAAPTSLAYWVRAKLPNFSSRAETALVEPTAAQVVVSRAEPVAKRSAMTEPERRLIPPAPSPTPTFAPVAPAPKVAAEPVELVPPPPPIAWQATAFLAWSLIVVVMTLMLIQRALFVRSLVAQSEEAPSELADLLDRCRGQMGMGTALNMRMTSLSASPSVCGLWRPRILMPQRMIARLDAQQMKSIVLHELAHVKRGDLWANLVQALLQIVYFFHPLLWLANWMIRRVREQAVDETVLAAMGDEAEDYPRTLLNVSKLAFGRPSLSLRLIGVVESKKALTARIKHIAGRPFPKSARLGLAGLVLVATVAAVLVPMAQATPEEEDKTTMETSEESGDTRTIQGIVVDTLGRPRECVYVAPQGTNVWKGVMSDAQGHFVLEDVTPEQTTWIAWSQASRLYGLFTLSPTVAVQPVRVVLNLDEADLAGRVVGADGKAMAEQMVELTATTADGIRFPLAYRPKTDAFGYYACNGLCGAGVTLEATALDADGMATSFSTGPAKVRPGQSFVEMPLLVAAEQKIQPDFDRNLSHDGMLHCRGHVVDESGTPIANVRVHLSFDMPNWMSMWVRDAMTDDQGRWHRAIPPQAMNLSLEFDHPEFYVEDNRFTPPRDELEQGTHSVTMKRGLILQGRVVNEQNRPVENVLVCAERSYSSTPSPYNQTIEDSTTARTRRDGTFSIAGLAPGQRTIGAYANDYAPKLQAVDLQPDMGTTTVVLAPGRTYRGQVVDGKGQAIEGVRVGVQTWRLGKDQRRMTRLGHTDAQGNFTLANLPEGEISLYFGKKPLMGFRKDLPEDLSEIDVSVMYEAPVFTGRVVDAETDEPVTEFRVVNGIKWERDDDSFSWSRYYHNDVKDANGLFEQHWKGYGISYPLASVACLKVEAPGYVPAIAPALEIGAECEPLTIRLRRGVSLAGTVLQPDGTAAAEAQVGFVRPGEMAFIDGYQFSERGFTYQAEIVEKTDSKGAFTLPAIEGRGLIVAVHKSGYAQIPSEEFTNESALPLLPWARLEGTIDRTQFQDESIQITLRALEQGSREAPSIHWLLENIAPTGDTFTLDYVPAIPVALACVCRYEPDNATLLQPEPGKTYSVAIGTPGREVTGQILFPSQVLQDKSIALTDPRQTHAVAFRVDEGGKVPPQIGALAESSFTWLWRDKERVYAPSQTVQKRFVPRIAEDGKFTFPGLEPGQYEFVVNIHAPLGENVSCGRGVLEGVAVAQFNVPQGLSDIPLRVADIQVKQLTYPGIGEPAPLFKAKTFDGQTIRLSDLRGKVVLLDFWASWCSPCVAELPKIQTLYETFADRDAFAMIGLSLDWDTERATRLLDEKQLSWTQACLGSMDESVVVKQYGVGEIPMTILIDTDGTILARGADVDTLTQRIEEALNR